ncbi:MAG: response regulator [Bacteroidota bacterium]
METNGTICIIEDNLPIRNLLALLFKREGFETVAFENGLDALAWIEINTPIAVMCDIMLADINGEEILERIRVMPHGESLPVIVITGFANASSREKYLAQGFNGYISKPINVATFVTEVKNILKSVDTQ